MVFVTTVAIIYSKVGVAIALLFALVLTALCRRFLLLLFEACQRGKPKAKHVTLSFSFERPLTLLTIGKDARSVIFWHLGITPGSFGNFPC